MVSLVSGVTVGLLVGGASVVIGLTGPASPARADTASTVTVHANQQDSDLQNAPMPDLAVTVSQTRDLQAQGIQVSWTGGKQSGVPNGGTGGSDFLQVMQCWGTDASGGPDRTTCQYGGFNTPGATRDSYIDDYATVPEQDQQFTIKGGEFGSPTYSGITFRGADGGKVEKVSYNKYTKVTSYADEGADQGAPRIDLNSNQYFTKYTTNEVSWAGSSATGEGSVKFEVQTISQSPGLGCGKPVVVKGGFEGASCWLVVIPRGTADTGTTDIKHSGLFWDSWKHRLAVKLDFLPIGVNCSIGASERQLSGSELTSVAIASWQPTLCSDGAAYTTITGAESDAVLAANGTTPAPMALTSRALKASTGVTDNLTYAPIALTGLSIGFAIDREVNVLGDVPDSAKGNARLPFTSLNLTPRLVAKLLTYSYTDSIPSGADIAHLGTNPRNITKDKEFLDINDPEWGYQNINSPALSDLILPQGRSDAAAAMWNYVLADQDAVDFLMGKADPDGMIVNPWSSINPDVYAAVSNGVGGPLVLPRDDFPKADPSERAKENGVDAVNVVTWRPYTNDLSTSANLVLRGDGQILGDWDPNSLPPKYLKASRSLPGLQRVLGLTDTGAAAKYQVLSANLRNPAGNFVAPTTASLQAAAAAMTADPAQGQVVRFDPTSVQAKSAPDAYPLTLPVYAATNRAMTDATLRNDYANFINYAATTGQEPGTAVGMLPDGYAPIPQSWQDQALIAAAAIAAGPVKAAATPKPTAAAKPPAAAAPQAAAAAAPASTPSAVSDPAPSGSPAGALTGKATPADAQVGAISAAVPLAIAAGLAAAILVPLLTRIRRRL
ncbi:hypothetical protein VD659_05035 [Herbiconiux sp. 11R-BC]|uniref:hypothetical protein n=1 Tax=Herbiconiux sp. 11R-BC TaxID=3111637 RepID=UPI003BFDC23D